MYLQFVSLLLVALEVVEVKSGEGRNRHDQIDHERGKEKKANDCKDGTGHKVETGGSHGPEKY